jgi:hypothetical protein
VRRLNAAAPGFLALPLILAPFARLDVQRVIHWAKSLDQPIASAGSGPAFDNFRLIGHGFLLRLTGFVPRALLFQ